jgi:hypothetical protein
LFDGGHQQLLLLPRLLQLHLLQPVLGHQQWDLQLVVEGFLAAQEFLLQLLLIGVEVDRQAVVRDAAVLQFVRRDFFGGVLVGVGEVLGA